MRSHAQATAEPSWLRRTWDKFSDYAIVVLALLLIVAVLSGWNNSRIARDSAATAAANTAATKKIAEKSLISQNNHHAESIADDKKIEAAEAVIAYEGGVITYLLGELSQGHVQTQQILAEVQAVQMELTTDVATAVAGIKGGQAQINAAITFQNQQTCIIETHLGLTCATAPPLPAT